MEDARILGHSYGYVVVPQGGKTVDGVKFPAGPRAAGKKGWFKLLVEAGCPEISEVEYEKMLKESQSSPAPLSGKVAEDGIKPDVAGRNKGKARRAGGGNKSRPRRDAGRLPDRG